MLWRLCVTAAIAVALTSCAAATLPYHAGVSAVQPGDYSEIPLGDNRYRVTYSAPRGTPAVELDRRTRLRAAELATDHGYPWLVVLERSINRGIYVIPLGDGSAPMTYRGTYKDWRRYWHFYCLGKGLQHCDEDPLWFFSINPSDVERVELALTVEFLREKPTRHDVIDARSLLDKEREP